MLPKRIVFLSELRFHCDREVCLGTAEYAASKPGWMFSPKLVEDFSQGALGGTDSPGVVGILSTEYSLKRLGRQVIRSVPNVVCVADHKHTDADTVCLDDEAVGAMAAEHLWTQGYRSLAFIGLAGAPWSHKRKTGFTCWLATAGGRPVVLLPPELLPPEDAVLWDWNIIATCAKGLDETLAALPCPCGIFAANDTIACAVVQAVHAIGRRIPDDFGVVGADNDPFRNAAAGLAISSVELPFREVGRRAAKMLEERWCGVGAGREERLPPLGVVVRASSNVFMTEDRLVRKAQAYIEAHRYERLTVAEVVRAVHSNRVTLGKQFQCELDTTLLDYVRLRRLDYAADQLRRGRRTVEEIAADCGYSSASSFSRVLKKLTGHRPGAVRRGD